MQSCCAKCADVSSLASPNFVKSEPELYRTMPNTTINSFKKENDKLKDEITALTGHEINFFGKEPSGS